MLVVSLLWWWVRFCLSGTRRKIGAFSACYEHEEYSKNGTLWSRAVAIFPILLEPKKCVLEKYHALHESYLFYIVSSL